MENRVYIFMALLCLNIPFSRATELIQDTDETFKYFRLMSIDLQIKILSHTDNPTVGLSLCKDIKMAMRRKYVWAKPDRVLAKFIWRALDRNGEIKPDSQLVTALNNETRQFMLRRLILGMSKFKREAIRGKARQLLVKHICDNIFFYKDKIIEMSRVYPKVSGELLRIARGDMAHGCPLVHEEQIPQGCKGYLKSAELELAQSTANSVYRVWRLKAHPQQPTFSTVSLRHGEEFAILYPKIINGHIQTEDTKIMYYNHIPRDWPLKN